MYGSLYFHHPLERCFKSDYSWTPLLLESPMTLLSDSDVDPTEDASLLLLSFMEGAVEEPFGNDADRLDGDDIFFATIATNATNAHEATTIIAMFLELFLGSIKDDTLPVVLLLLSVSEVTVELEVVAFTPGLEINSETGDIVNVGSMLNLRHRNP